jgi:hypothetical protein
MPKRKTKAPAWAPTENQRLVVLASCLASVKPAVICAVTKITPKQLREHFKDELEGGREALELRLTATVLGIAGNPEHHKQLVAALATLNSKFGWAQKAELEAKFTVNIVDNYGPAADAPKRR